MDTNVLLSSNTEQTTQESSNFSMSHTRFTPSSTTTVDNRSDPSHSAFSYQSKRRTLAMGLFPPTSFLMQTETRKIKMDDKKIQLNDGKIQLIESSTTDAKMNSSSIPNSRSTTFKRSMSCIPMSSPVGSNANPNYLSIASTMSTTTQPRTFSSPYSTNQNIPAIPYTQPSKHKLWNSSSKRLSNSFLPYPTPSRNSFADKFRDSALQISDINSNGTIKNIDILSSSYCSDSDLLDVSGYEKVSTTNQVHRVVPSTTNSLAKKRNPYSIEELLKKPDIKTRRIEQLSFQPSVIVSNDDNTNNLQPPLNTVVSNTNESKCKNNNNNHVTIEVSD